QNVQSQLSTNNCGMSLDFLGFKRIGLPEDVTEAVFTRMKSERQELISKYQSDGDAEAAKIRSAAERQAAAVMARANEEAIGIRAQGEREAASTYGVFEQNPQLAEFLLRIDALQRSMNRKTTLIFDERQPPFDLFMHLPTNAPAAASAGKNDTASGQ
ncbi:MAG: hypothetical protein KGR98_06775, partial [Verrucomicrobia bacterium]|nr:hypothetical protein [Verrucomicrobiota bacterium]